MLQARSRSQISSGSLREKFQHRSLPIRPFLSRGSNTSTHDIRAASARRENTFPSESSGSGGGGDSGGAAGRPRGRGDDGRNEPPGGGGSRVLRHMIGVAALVRP
jgi:hypothetical protein